MLDVSRFCARYPWPGHSAWDKFPLRWISLKRFQVACVTAPYHWCCSSRPHYRKRVSTNAEATAKRAPLGALQTRTERSFEMDTIETQGLSRRARRAVPHSVTRHSYAQTMPSFTKSDLLEKRAWRRTPVTSPQSVSTWICSRLSRYGGSDR